MGRRIGFRCWTVLGILGTSVSACGGGVGGGSFSDGGIEASSGGTGGLGGMGIGGNGATGNTGSGGVGGDSPDAGACGPTPLGFPGSCKPGAPETCCDTQLPVMVKAGGVTPNWSCIGIGSGGSGGAGGTGTGQNVFRVESFPNGGAVPDIGVELYAGDTIIGQSPFHTGFTDGPLHPGPTQLNEGELAYFHPGTPTLSYRVLAQPGVAMDFFGFGLDALPAPATVMGATMSPTLFEQLANFAVPIVGWSPPDDLALVLGHVRDCDGNDVGGALVKLIDEATNQEVVPGTCERDLRYIYFDSQYPNPKCAYTEASNGQFLLANAEANASGPKAGQKFRVELWGRLRATDTSAVRFAERSVDLFPAVMNAHELRPNVQQ